MKFPKIRVNDKPAFEKRLMIWRLMRDAIGDGSWNELAYILGADKYVQGTKRIKKKRLRKYMCRLVVQDLYEQGKCEHVST